MTATITTIQNALKAALDAIPNESRPTPFTTRIQEADISPLPASTAPADVVIGFEASARLSRTGATILEQVLVPVAVRRRFAQGKQSDADVNNALAELLRDTAADYHSATARVEQLLSPHPMDVPSAVEPGMFVSRFVCDFDVLRSVSGITQDVTTPSKILTKVRTAAWNAINNWSEFDVNTWQRKFQQDADLDELALHDPGRFDLPAIAITWGPTTPRFFAHTVQDWPATLNVTAWFPAYATTLAEYRAWQIVRAIYQCAPVSTPTVSYIRAATGRIPEKDAPITIEPVELGRSQQLKALKLTCSFVLTGLVAPLNE